MGAVPALAPALSHAEGFDFSEDADDIALRQADAAKDLEQPVKQMPFSQFVDQCQATLQKELQQKIRGNEDTLIAHAKIRAAYINIDQACNATRWAKEANISNASGVPGLGLYIDLYQGVLKKPERLARALHEKHFFYHLYRYRQLMQWYNEAGKKHETGLENLPQQFLSLISTISLAIVLAAWPQRGKVRRFFERSLAEGPAHAAANDQPVVKQFLRILEIQRIDRFALVDVLRCDLCEIVAGHAQAEAKIGRAHV